MRRHANPSDPLVLAAIVCASVFAGCASTRWDQGRPRIYQLDYIRRVAVLGFGHDEFTDHITEILVNHSKWRVMDRATLNRIFREQNLQHSARFDKATAVRLGKLAGVNAVIFGQYQHRRAVVKVIDVQTGEYLVYKNVDLSKWGDDVSFKAYYCCKHLVPYAIKIVNGQVRYIRVGGNVDQKDPSELRSNE